MSFSSNVAETQSLFGIYAIMGTPMIMSFDIRDDSKLLPIWNTLTNEEVCCLVDLACSTLWVHLFCGVVVTQTSKTSQR